MAAATTPGRDVAGRLRAVRERVAEACLRAGRDPAGVRLVAVSKQIPLPLVAAACAAGQRDLGENRIQDALPRQAQLARLLAAAHPPSDPPRWHFIGNLQRNKAGKAAGAFVLLHAVDSDRLAAALQERCAAAGVRQPVLVEVNLSGEARKHGAAPAGALALLETVAAAGSLDLRGLMTMARWGAPEPELRRTFAGLRRLQQEGRARTGLELPELSMGMSDDFEAAIAEGSTIVRIGTAIFGPREPAPAAT